MSVVMPASVEASAVDHAAELVERERIGIAVLLQLQLGRADHFLHEPQRYPVAGRLGGVADDVEHRSRARNAAALSGGRNDRGTKVTSQGGAELPAF